jgi:tetratricopeptide (TPR) repeat protein
VGEVSEARRLAEEAYERAPTPEGKANAADLRGVMATDLDDRITWLKRSNTDLPDIRAALSAALGQKAAQDGNEEEAISHLRAAIADYDRLPANHATLNNGALAHSALYRLTGDPGDFVRARKRIERALALLPGDSILLKNAATFALEGAMQNVVGKALDLQVLRGRTGTQLLNYLYTDRTGRDRLNARLRDQQGFTQAVQHYEQLLVLAPRDSLAPSALTGLYSLVHDLPALRRLEERMRTVDLDLERATRETLENYQGKNLDKQRSEHKVRLAQRRKTLEAARKVGGVTFAVAADDLVVELGRAESLDLPADLDEAVRLAEEAAKLVPSRATRTSLTGALLVRAGRDLANLPGVDEAGAARARAQLPDRAGHDRGGQGAGGGAGQRGRAARAGVVAPGRRGVPRRAGRLGLGDAQGGTPQGGSSTGQRQAGWCRSW